jgi:hypothetical protein
MLAHLFKPVPLLCVTSGGVALFIFAPQVALWIVGAIIVIGFLILFGGAIGGGDGGGE